MVLTTGLVVWPVIEEHLYKAFSWEKSEFVTESSSCFCYKYVLTYDFLLTPTLSERFGKFLYVWVIFWGTSNSQKVKKKVISINLRLEFLVIRLIIDKSLSVNFVIVKKPQNFWEFISQEKHIRISIWSAYGLHFYLFLEMTIRFIIKIWFHRKLEISLFLIIWLDFVKFQPKKRRG